MAAVTVVITTYNLERFIARCIDDLMRQTLRDFDVLLIDDHSTDKTVTIIRGYLNRYPDRIHALFLPGNLGSSSRTRNAALDSGLITGEYAVFLDGDDRIEQNFLECLYMAVRMHDADISVCSFDRFDAVSGHKVCAELQWLPDGETLAGEDPAVAFLNGALWNKMIRVRMIGNSRIPDLKIGEDVAFALMLYNRCNRIACVRRDLIHYQVHSGSIITGTDKEAIIRFADELARQYKSASINERIVLALSAYLHIVLSMMMRAADNATIDLAGHYQWTKVYCRTAFSNFAAVKPSMFYRISGQKAKGAIIHLSFLCYKCGLLLPALKTLRLYTRVTGKDIKW